LDRALPPRPGAGTPSPCPRGSARSSRAGPRPSSPARRPDDSRNSFLALQPLPLVKVLQGPDQLAHVAGDDRVQFVEREVDAVVGQAVLREVVGADALAAVARADQRAALLGAGAVQLLLLPLVQLAAQPPHGPLVV